MTQAKYPAWIQRPPRIDAVNILPPATRTVDWRALFLRTFEVRSMVRVMKADPTYWYFQHVGRYFDVKAVNAQGVWVHPQFTEMPLRPIWFDDVDL